MDKKQRQNLVFKHYRRRLKNWMSNLTTIINKDGEEIINPKLIDLLNQNVQYQFKQTNVRCSCSMCAYDKYKRHEKKAEDQRLLEDYYNEC